MASAFETTISALEGAGVRYLVVGGVAVVLHGHLRTTADLDLVIELSDDNVARAIEALTKIGLRPRLPVPAADFADPAKRRSWIEDKGMTVFSLWDPKMPGFGVDLFAEVPFDFEAAHAHSVRVQLDSTPASVIALADLIEMKRRAGRPRDLDDVLHLEALADLDDPS